MRKDPLYLGYAAFETLNWNRFYRFDTIGSRRGEPR